MATQRVGTGRFQYDPGTGTVTVNLGTRLFHQTYGERRTRYIGESDDLSLREVVTVGSAVKTLKATFRFHDDPDEAVDMISAGLDGATLTYSPDGGTTELTCLLIDASDVEPDPDLEGKGYYQVTLTLQATGSTTDFDALKDLP